MTSGRAGELRGRRAGPTVGLPEGGRQCWGAARVTLAGP
jgi:hypothetical protein